MFKLAFKFYYYFVWLNLSNTYFYFNIILDSIYISKSLYSIYSLLMKLVLYITSSYNSGDIVKFIWINIQVTNKKCKRYNIRIDYHDY